MTPPLFASARGAGDPPILFIHGCSSDGNFFHGAADILSARHLVIEYDRRGYGRSPQPENADYSILAQAEDAIDLLCRYAPDRSAYIVAHSGGTNIALELAAAAPDMLRGMILVEPVQTFDNDVQRRIDTWFDQMQAFCEDRKLTLAMRSLVEFAGIHEESGAGGGLEGIAQSYGNIKSFLYGEMSEIRRYLPSEAQLCALTMPVAVVVSEAGADMVYGRTAAKLSERFHWPRYDMPGYHNSPQYHPEEFAALTERILLDLSEPA